MHLKHIFFIALGLILGGLLVRFGAAAVMVAAVPLLKLAVPLVAAYLGVRFLRTKLQQLGDDRSPRQAEAIDICPECGEVKSSRHLCRQSKR